MPKNNPYYIPKENYKKTEEIREIDSKYEIPTFEEFMRDYKSNEKLENSYNSELKSYEDIRINRSYGPGYGQYDKMEEKDLERYRERWKREEAEEERKKEQDLCLKNGCWESRKYGDRKYCSKHREDADSGEWAAKVALGIGASALLGPVGTLVAGSTLWGASEVGKAASSNEDAKETWNSFSSLGSGMVKGEMISSEIAKFFGGGKLHDAIQSGVTYGQPAWEFAVHETHKSNGISYDSSCEICKKS